MAFRIRVPAWAIDHFWEEPPPDSPGEFWAFKERPKVDVGDPIEFTFGGAVIARAVCAKIEPPGESACDTTGRFRNHWKVMWRNEDFEDMRPKG